MPTEQNPVVETTQAFEQRMESRSDRRDSWTMFMFVVSVFALLFGVIAIGFGSRAISDAKRKVVGSTLTAAPGSANAPGTVMLDLSEFKILPADFTVAAGGSLQVMNVGTMTHNLAIKDTQLATAMLGAGKSADLSLAGLTPGTYTVYCQVSGHEPAGMTATLHVVAAAGTSVKAPAAAGPTTTAPMTSDQMDAAMADSMKAFPAKTVGLGAQPLTPNVLADGTKQFALTAEVVRWEVSPGSFVDAWTYNGTVPGPTIHVNPGDKVQVVLHNRLPESTAVHFHGIVAPNSMDGVPFITQDPVKPGQSFTYSWTAQSSPAVGMYHSHADAVKQVPNGLAGAFLIGDEPLPPGVTVSQQQIMMLNDSGTIGLSINGKGFPATTPVAAKLGDWVEVQYMNEGQMIHPMHLHGMAQLIIAKDGYPVAQPYNADTVTVAPGERYTVLVHADNPGVWAWHCHILSHAENAQGMFGMVTALIVK